MTEPVPMTKIEQAREAANLEAEAAKKIVDALKPITITTQEMCVQIDGIVKEAKRLEKALEAREKKITVPMNAVLKSVRDDFRPARDAYKQIEAIGKPKIAAFLAEAERLRTESYQAGVQALQEGRPEAQALLTQAAHATEAEAPRGTSVRYAWEATVDDPRAVPRELCTPCPKLIRAYLAQFPVEKAAPEIPGLSIARTAITTMRTK